LILHQYTKRGRALGHTMRCLSNHVVTSLVPELLGKDALLNETVAEIGVFWLYNWFQEDNNNMNIFFLMNGNIFNYPLVSILEHYTWNCGLFGFGCDSAYGIPPSPPSSTNTMAGEPIFSQSYINAYNTAFNQETKSFNGNYQKALYNYVSFTYGDVNNNFVNGTFGYDEEYNTNSQSFYINYLQDNESVYSEAPCLFISAGSGGGSGYMYLDWIIVTYGVPYIINVG